MDFWIFLSSVKNLYYPLFIVILGVVILSIFFSLENGNADRVKMELHNKEIRHLNHEIKQLEERTKSITELSKEIQETLSELPKNKKYNKLRESLQQNFLRQVDLLKKEREQIETERINAENWVR